MNDWRKRFAEKMEFVREVALARFDEFASKTLGPLYEEFSAFTGEHGVKAANPLANGEARTYRFSVAENAYVLLTFRSAGVERCELLSEFSVPNREKPAPVKSSVNLLDADDVWARRAFEESLERFAEAVAEAFAEKPRSSRVLVGA